LVKFVGSDKVDAIVCVGVEGGLEEMPPQTVGILELVMSNGMHRHTTAIHLV